jgi:hypothetical protein
MQSPRHTKPPYDKSKVCATFIFGKRRAFMKDNRRQHCQPPADQHSVERRASECPQLRIDQALSVCRRTLEGLSRITLFDGLPVA